MEWKWVREPSNHIVELDRIEILIGQQQRYLQISKPCGIDSVDERMTIA